MNPVSGAFRMIKFKLVAQEDPMGCGIACIASLLKITYDSAKRLFPKDYSSTRGYYIKEISNALEKKGLVVKYGKFNNKTKEYANKEGSIVFIKRSEKFPYGHYLLKTDKGWMNPWINYPKINPAKAGYEKNIPGEIQWIIYKA